MEPSADAPAARQAPPRYHITPRYLADADPEAPDLILTILHSAGWSVRTDDLGNAHALDPTHRFAVRFLPEDDDVLPGAGHILWRIHAHTAPHHDATWLAAWTDGTPHEMLLPVLSALLADPDAAASPLPEDALLTSGDTAVELLLQAGWQPDPTGLPRTAHAPGLRAMLTHRPHPAHPGQPGGAWRVEARPTAASPPLWAAVISDTTPLHLLRALATALADPAPATRHSLPLIPTGDITLAPADRGTLP